MDVVPVSAVARRPAVPARRGVEAKTITLAHQPQHRPQELEVWTDTRYALLTRVRTAVRRGEVRECGGFQPVPGTAGWFTVKVWRLRPPVPAWRRAAPWVLGGLSVLAAVVAAIGYALSLAVAAVATVPLWVWVAGAVLLLAGGGGATTVIVKVVVR